MTDRQSLQKVKDRYQRLELSRQELQRLSSEAQRLSKQAIFSLQRKDVSKATESLSEAERKLVHASKLVAKENRLGNEGMWRAALEEYCEACFCEKIVKREPLFPPQKLTEDPDILLGGVSDAIGEAARMVVAAATAHDVKEVERLYELALNLVEFLTSLDLTGSLRSKGDQARQHLRKIEDIRYDLSRHV